MSVNIDANSRDIGHGVYFHKGRFIPLTFSVNPSTKAVLIEVIPHAIGTINVPNRMPIDANSVNVSGGLTNDTFKVLTPLSMDKLVGFPLLRIEKI